MAPDFCLIFSQKIFKKIALSENGFQFKKHNRCFLLPGQSQHELTIQRTNQISRRKDIECEGRENARVQVMTGFSVNCDWLKIDFRFFSQSQSSAKEQSRKYFRRVNGKQCF